MIKDVLKDIVWPSLISVLLFTLLQNLDSTRLSERQTKDSVKSSQPISQI